VTGWKHSFRRPWWPKCSLLLHVQFETGLESRQCLLRKKTDLYSERNTDIDTARKTSIKVAIAVKHLLRKYLK